AVFLSIAFLFAWGALAPRLFPELARKPVAATAEKAPEKRAPARAGGPPAPARTSASTPAAQPAPAPLAAAEAIAASSPEIVVVESPIYRAEFSNRGAQLVSFKLRKYPQKRGGEPVDLVAPRAAGSSDYPFAIGAADPAINKVVNSALYRVERTAERDATVLRFRWSEGGVNVEKTFRFDPARYLFGFDIRMTTPREVPWRVAIGPGLRNLLPEEEGNRFAQTGLGIVQIEGDLETLPKEKAEAFQIFEGRPEFVGIEDNYFLSVLKPQHGGAATLRRTEVPSAIAGAEPRPELYAGLNAAGGQVAGTAYFGPKEVARLDEYGLENTLQFGIFGFISRVLLTALIWINTWTLNYGWAIVVLTVIIKILLYPLQHKSMVSMKRMQLVQPKMNAIKERYKKAKTDPEQRQKMNLEMMKLYKDEGINPASGCVPLLLQLPILWGFYTLLSRAIELRGAPWILWIADLSVKDPYYITPILMTVTMFIQQWMTPTTADPVQRKVFLVMPIVFGWLFKEFPSGLVLYWLVQNILSIIQQWITNRYWHTPQPKKAKG
ncbi:MAG TPA: membrane protein insertase YidC, partial [Thermoanaerobaculia bacterium]|nr:membrane protein insertase YidC [Thermoanaerobaculia bacterium]